MSAIDKLHQLGQSIWYDNIERRLLKNGEMEKMIIDGEIRGVTSNPSIFQNAIAKSTDYDSAIQPLAWSDWDAEEIFFQLAIEDIREACDLFLPLYKESDGSDGYVSLEVNPKLAYDTDGTTKQVKELWERVNRKNLMVKIPATKEGLPAIRKSIATGINVNVTLIFSVERYEEVIDAYLSGLEERISKNLPVEKIASVASFFVSRVDSKVDGLLEDLLINREIDSTTYQSLKGKAAIANSRLAYELYEREVHSERFKKLIEKKAKMQRPLWASTSTKNPDYRDVVYVEELIAENTVNTVPPKTLDAFRDHGDSVVRIKDDLENARQLFPALERVGILISDVTQALEDEGVSAFEKAFVSLLATIKERKDNFQRKISSLTDVVSRSVQKLDEIHLISRLYEKDPTIWTKKPDEFEEIQKRLGWLDAPYFAREYIVEINNFRDEIIREGYTHAVLLGMGGSSLATEVFSLSFRGVVDGLSLKVLDSTDPRQVISTENEIPLEKTLFIVASKSGGTSEVQALMKYFYRKTKTLLGNRVGNHFIAITDPDTILEKQAKDLGFRKVFYADPTVGGRFSALTKFGLIPAALIGVDLDSFIQNSLEFSTQCRPGVPAARNPGLVLGVILAEAAIMGKDKLTIVAEEPFRSFGSWLEQLIAESTGKEGKGIVPIDVEPFVDSKHYSQDRLIVYLKNDGIFENIIEEYSNNNLPIITFDLRDPYDLGSEFFRWELATAVACSLLGVNAFNQSDVQDNKNRTKQKIEEFIKTGAFSFEDPIIDNERFSVYSHNLNKNDHHKELKEIIKSFLSQGSPNDFVAINAYLPRNKKVEAELQEFRKYVLSETNLATTLGFGPRFLHSTGQLHKGGPDSELIIQIVDSPEIGIDIPEMKITFRDLLYAQGVGDYEALAHRNRRIIRIQLKTASIWDLWH